MDSSSKSRTTSAIRIPQWNSHPWRKLLSNLLSKFVLESALVKCLGSTPPLERFASHKLRSGSVQIERSPWSLRSFVYVTRAIVARINQRNGRFVRFAQISGGRRLRTRTVRICNEANSLLPINNNWTHGSEIWPTKGFIRRLRATQRGSELWWRELCSDYICVIESEMRTSV